jgi:hypothetical protein
MRTSSILALQLKQLTMKYNIGSQGNLTLTSQTEGGLYDLFEKTFNIPSVIKALKLSIY